MAVRGTPLTRKDAIAVSTWNKVLTKFSHPWSFLMIDNNETIYRFSEVLRITGAKRSSVYKWIQEGHFPRPKKIGPRAIGWNSKDISAWIDNLPDCDFPKSSKTNAFPKPTSQSTSEGGSQL